MAESHTLPEGGLLIVTLPDQGAVGPLRSHYFDPRAAQGKIRDALVKWFKIWGIALSGSTKNPTWLERHTTEVVWCDSIPAELHGPQTVKHFIQTGEKVAEVIEETRPKVILVLSAYLYEAMASDALAPRISAVIGKALYPPRRITTMRLKALEQRFEHAQILVLPTPSKNTTEEYVRSLSASVREAFERAGFDLNATGDALIDAARSLLVLDEKRTLEILQAQLRIDPKRAQGLIDTLEEKGIISSADHRGLRFFKR